MFLTFCAPIGSKPNASFFSTSFATLPETQIPPGSASCSRRAAMFTPSPWRSVPSTITSPRLTPMRTSMRWSSGRPAFRSAMPRWMSTAHSTASTTLAELGEKTVAHQLEDCAAMRRDRRLDKFSSTGLKPLESSRLVQLHQTAVAGDVGGEDGGELPFDERAVFSQHYTRIRVETSAVETSRGCESDTSHRCECTRMLRHTATMKAPNYIRQWGELPID